MDEILKNLPKLAKDTHIENKKFFVKLKKKPPRHLDVLMQELHDAEFRKTDCLNCANCCKTTGPLFTDRDVARISKHLRIKEQKFIETYLRVDEDNDFVLKSVDLGRDTTVVQAEAHDAPLLFKICAVGKHYAMNGLGALAAAEALGADLALAAQSLGRWSPYQGRGAREVIHLDPVETQLTLELIDDT